MGGAVREPVEALLQRIEDHWQALEAPVLPHVLPGLSDGQMDEMCEPYGLVLGEELRAWWGWHDGSGNGNDEPMDSPKSVLPHRTMLSLGDALSYTSWMRARLSTMNPPDEVELLWRPWWLRPLSAGLIAVCGPDGPTRLLVDEPTLDAGGPRELFSSMHDFLALWVDALDLDVLVLDEGKWSVNPSAYTRHSDLVTRLSTFIPV